MLWIAWLIVAVLCVLIEVQTGTFYFLLLGGAALVSMGFALTGVSLLVQAFIFAGTALLLYAVALPYLKRKLGQRRDAVFPPAGQLVGQTAIVAAEIRPGEVGQAKVNGELWSAVSDETVGVGEQVVIVQVKVTKLVVRKG
ncbi:hypothetical protein SD70_16250 [Gordoniibacillus kamchatkensis]|uniref:NfeD-like C-terminal domain-containing protein n=1 Tax=Gordoniibacillus kamchatkensis TaxID=1590651 RepID=A0ABR5AGB5_9BACL|nr:NfeD family protein [Paenibacillus sp. VKM B-2647]KIL40069.1 hypothetical protein SD70_16250 [Paenibacillus sp. VKM B-2647]